MRRKFYEAAKYDKQAQKPLKILNQIFNLEKGWKILSGSERQLKRLDELSPLLDIFWNCLNSLATLPKSLLGKAIVYARGQKESINKLVKYGELDISDNTCEQAVKSLVIDRKNFLFSTSVANVIWLTLIESAKANGLDPEQYLGELLNEIPQFGPFVSAKQLEDYLPWNRYNNKIVQIS